MEPLQEIIRRSDHTAGLEVASTIPAAWYTDPRVYAAEQQTVFSRSWLVTARADQVRDPGGEGTPGTKRSSFLSSCRFLPGCMEKAPGEVLLVPVI